MSIEKGVFRNSNILAMKKTISLNKIALLFKNQKFIFFQLKIEGFLRFFFSKWVFIIPHFQILNIYTELTLNNIFAFLVVCLITTSEELFLK